MPRDINRGLRSPTNRRTLQCCKQTIGKLYVFTKIVVTEIDVATASRFNISNDLIHRASSIHAVVDRSNRAIFTRERTPARCLYRINYDSIFFDQVVTWNRKIVDVRRFRGSVARLKFAVLNVVEYLRPNFVAFTDHNRIKKTFNAIGQHRRQITSEHNFLPGSAELFGNVDAA